MAPPDRASGRGGQFCCFSRHGAHTFVPEGPRLHGSDSLFHDLAHVILPKKCQHAVDEFWPPEIGSKPARARFIRVVEAMGSEAVIGRQDIFLGTRDCQGYVTPCVFGEEPGDDDNDGSLDNDSAGHGMKPAYGARSRAEERFENLNSPCPFCPNQSGN